MVRVLRKTSANRNAAFYLTLAASGTPGGTRTPDLLLRRQLLYPAELKAHICFRTAFRLRPPKRAGAAQIKSEANADQSHITHRAPHAAIHGGRHTAAPSVSAGRSGGGRRRILRARRFAGARRRQRCHTEILPAKPASDAARCKGHCRKTERQAPREARRKPNPAARWSG